MKLRLVEHNCDIMIDNKEEIKYLLIQTQKGDKKAYHLFLTKLSPYITKKVRFRIFNEGDVADVVQECLISIHRSLPTYDSKRDVLPWVVAITERRIVDYIRKKNRQMKLQNELGPNVTNEEFVAKYELEDLKILDQLPEVTKKAIELTKLHGHSTKEAALKLGLSEDALRARISRGLGRIQEMVREESNNE